MSSPLENYIVSIIYGLSYIVFFILLILFIRRIIKKQLKQSIQYFMLLLLLGFYICSTIIASDIYYVCKDLMIPNAGKIYKLNVNNFKSNYYKSNDIDKHFLFFSPEFSFKTIEDKGKSYLVIYCNGYDFDDDGGDFITLRRIQCLIPFMNGDIYIQKYEIID